MGYNENKIEKYLDNEVKKIGGITRKWVSPGHAGVPDRIVFFDGFVFFIEVKAPTGLLKLHQIREISNLKKHGATVLTLYSQFDIDIFISDLKNKYANN